MGTFPRQHVTFTFTNTHLYQETYYRSRNRKAGQRNTYIPIQIGHIHAYSINLDCERAIHTYVRPVHVVHAYIHRAK
uniref:Uncharacterized protein n=1 Tax=Anguilla anguilla TaxID=7936 RepID=A0A0E9U9M6_ANGAN